MVNVVFVAPFLLETTLRFASVTADLPGVRTALITQDPPEKVPPGLASRTAVIHRVRNALDPRELETAARSLAGGLGGVTRLFGPLEQLQVPLAQVRESLGIEGMDVVTAHNFRDKDRMKRVLARAGIPVARHVLATDIGAVVRFAEDVGYPLVLKPPAGAGARNTVRVDDGARLAEILRLMPPRANDPLLVEEFLTGDERSFDSVFLRGEPMWYSVSEYYPTPLKVMENDWIQWCVHLPREVDGPEYDGIRNAAAPALRALGLGTGLTHMEWFRRPDGSVAVSEVAARPPGAQFTTLLSYAHDIDFYRAWARLMVLEEFTPPERKYSVGAAYLRGMGAGRVTAVHGLEQAQKELGGLVAEARIPKPGQPAAGTYEGEGYVILRHPDSDTVREALARVVQLVRVELKS